MVDKKKRNEGLSNPKKKNHKKAKLLFKKKDRNADRDREADE